MASITSVDKSLTAFYILDNAKLQLYASSKYLRTHGAD